MSRLALTCLVQQNQCFNTEKKLKNFWGDKIRAIECMSQDQLRLATRTQELPLARVKKVMKLDDQVKEQMISVDVPVLMSKACEMLCERLTLAAWKVTEEGKRKTLVKSDIAEAVAADDKLDFLVDIVPRPERRRGGRIEGRVYSADSGSYSKPVEIFPAQVVGGRVYVEREPGIYHILEPSDGSAALLFTSNQRV